MRILVVEDEQILLSQIERFLRRSGYVIDGASRGVDGWHLGDTEPYDAVILDRMLPDAGEGFDGLSILKQWRDAGRTMPVLMLTARSRWTEKVEGLRAGADDYLAKPFEFEEMLARVEALLRRGSGNRAASLKCDDVVLDTATGWVWKSGTLVELTNLEFRALSFLLHNAGKIISKSELIEHIYDMNFESDSNVIEAVISRLRRKLGPYFIKTFRGRGYSVMESST